LHIRLSGIATTGVPSPRQQQQQLRYTWSDVKIINISIIISTPGSTDQKWHADGGHVDIEQHLPCHCCNIFIPLTAITKENGPTKFRPRSHYYTRQLTPLMLLAKVRKELLPIDAPLVSSSLGDIIMFDYRILHRGRGNNTSPSQQQRTVRVATTVHDTISLVDVHADPSHNRLIATSTTTKTLTIVSCHIGNDRIATLV
jgi:ectoine hydroxylase-related dioxygenase (phytanoyl-CoA dioxygenase family)